MEALNIVFVIGGMFCSCLLFSYEPVFQKLNLPCSCVQKFESSVQDSMLSQEINRKASSGLLTPGSYNVGGFSIRSRLWLKILKTPTLRKTIISQQLSMNQFQFQLLFQLWFHFHFQSQFQHRNTKIIKPKPIPILIVDQNSKGIPPLEIVPKNIFLASR